MREAGQGAPRRWRIWIDTGGTFTDCVARAPDGSLRRAKVLSSAALRARVVAVPAPAEVRVEGLAELPAGLLEGCELKPLRTAARPGRVRAYDARRRRLVLERPPRPGLLRGDEVEIDTGEEAPVLAARIVTGTPRAGRFPPLEARLATTRGTNALLERRGAPTALFITAGFGDLLAIGTQQRPELFTLRVRKPEPLYAAVVEVDERLAADGRVLRPLATAGLEGPVAALLASGVKAAAVALLHSYRDPTHELRLAAFLSAQGFAHVSCSAALVPLVRLLPRAETAVVDAYLASEIGDYLAAVERELGGAPLRVMTSAGGLVRAAAYRPKDSLLSGPAGGVVGAAAAGARSGRRRIIAFDMGGTSTDVSRYEQGFDYRFETRVGAARLLTPALAIETVAAGGGSVCRFDGHRLRVGPESAGARPGPACYGAGGPLCLTDVNLLLGRLEPERFGIPVDRSAAEAAAGRLLERVGGRAATAPEEALAGLLRIADERMADAVREISVRQGYDPAAYALVAFGGAGPQHACALAELLGVGRILIPADAGLLSALGLGAARIERFAERQVLAPLAAVAASLEERFKELAAEAGESLRAEGVAAAAITVRLRRAELRLAGQDATLAVDDLTAADATERFAAAYRARYGYAPPRRPVEVESLRVVAADGSSMPPPAAAPPPRSEAPRPARRSRAWVAGGWRELPVFEREHLRPGHRLPAPALVVEAHTATLVAPGWRAEVDGAGALALGRGETRRE